MPIDAIPVNLDIRHLKFHSITSNHRKMDVNGV